MVARSTLIHNVYFLSFVIILFLSGFKAQAAHWVPLQSGGAEEESSVDLLEDNPSSLLIKWELKGVYLNEIKTASGVFNKIAVGEGIQVYSGEPGSPALPNLTEIISLPPSTKGEIKLVDAEWVSIGKYRLYPNQPPTRDDGSNAPPFELNEKIYNQNIDLPAFASSINSPQGWGGVAVASISVIPVRYNPSTQEVQVASSITVKVDFVAGQQAIVRPEKISRRIAQLHNIAILNPPAFNPQPFDFDENEPVRMLIVIKEEALEFAQPLIDFHHASGLKSEVFFADDIEEPEELKGTVREYYEEGLEYLFIIGDSYRFDWDIPMFYWDPEDPGLPVADTDTHSDSWYVCLDGPDEDGFDDHLPDLSVGRLTYESPDEIEELEIQVGKIDNYLNWNFENPDDSEWLSRAVLVATDARQDGVQVYKECKQRVENFNYALEAPELIPFYGDDAEVDIGALEDEINQTGIGFFNYRGHGSELALYRCLHNRSIDGGVVNRYDNLQRPFILVSSACLNGDIAVRHSDCILEKFQKKDGASVSAHGSVISTFTDGNSYFDERIFRAFFDDGVFDIGYAGNLAMTEMVLHFDRPNVQYRVIGRMNARAYIWLGDPALEYRLTAPIQFEIDIPDTIALANQLLEGTISAGGEPFSDAKLCFRTENDDIYQVAWSDNDGDISIEFEPRLEEAGTIYWTATYRDAIPASGSILVADGFGVIAGEISDLEDGSSVENAVLDLIPFHLNAVSDVNGHFVIDNVPERESYTLRVSADGYLQDEVQGLNIQNNDTAWVDFALRFGQLEVDTDEQQNTMRPEEQMEIQLPLENSGNGTLEWTAVIASANDSAPYELLQSIELSDEIGDDRLNGVVLINDLLYLAGGNHNQDPNYIYILDMDGRLQSRFEQPQHSVGIGIHDLAWDGEYLYGSAAGTIFQMTLEGTLINEFDGPFNPNAALTADDDGNLWVANNRTDLVKIDTEGNVLDQIVNNYPVRALGWYKDEPDGYSLMMFVRGEINQPKLYQANPGSGEVKYIRDLTETEGDMPADGLTVTRDYGELEWNLLGIINQGALRYLKSWHLDYITGWIRIETESGQIPAQDTDMLAITFDAKELEIGDSLATSITIRSNGRRPLVEIPLSLNIYDPDGVEEGSEIGLLPGTHRVSQAFPNPFNAVTSISIDLSSAAEVKVTVHDLHGRQVTILSDSRFNAGSHDVTINAENLPSGVYLLRVAVDGNRLTRKITLLR